MQRFTKIVVIFFVILIWGLIIWNIESATGVKPSRSLLVAIVTILMIISVRAIWRWKTVRQKDS
ncbi:MAG TPA: hypothetical protein VGH64_03350 [Puia sp.]